MKTFLVVIVFALSAWRVARGCQETNISNARPEIAINPETISFGQVSLLTIDSRPIVVTNEGTGWLEFESVELVDDGGGSFWVSTEPQSIASGEEWVLNVSFTPTAEDAASGTLRIATNSVDNSVIDIPLDGLGVRPVLDISPTIVHFDTDEGAETEEASILGLESTGSGPVILEDVELHFNDNVAFSATLPQSVQLPYELEPGLSIEIEVTHEPDIGETYETELHIYSNDLNDEDQVVTLKAGDGGSTGEAPTVVITAPNSGYALQVGGVFDLEGIVEDPDQPNNSLAVSFSSNLQGALGTTIPDANGNVALYNVELELGSHTVSLVALDATMNLGVDSISVLVWEEGQKFDYTISGGDTIYHYFEVDDDITFYLNGTPFFIDNNGGLDLHAPIPLEAAPGDVIRIEATDTMACTKILDDTYLHLNEGNIQPLNDYIIVSACDDHPNYDPGYTGPWPNVFLDEEYVISIP